MTVRVTGDTLALDAKLTRRINDHATRLQQHQPDGELRIEARIAEEFDQLHGHRVRFELITLTAENQQIIVRDARKKAEEAIDQAFTSLKSKLRRLRLREITRQSKEGLLRPTGT